MQGESGTGKSFLINALTGHLKSKCKVRAYTNKAAKNIN